MDVEHLEGNEREEDACLDAEIDQEEVHTVPCQHALLSDSRPINLGSPIQ